MQALTRRYGRNGRRTEARRTEVESGRGGVAPVDEVPGRAYRGYLLVVIGLVVVIFSSVGAANYELNPLVYDQGYIRRAAQAMVDGKNFANYDPNIDFRALRREQISLMKDTPDVVIFGGSRWQELHPDLIPGKTVFNAYVSNDHVEDMMAIVYLLEEAGRLPKTMIFSERFITFQPVVERDAAEWQQWAPQYRAMAHRLGIQPHSYFDTIPVEQWSGMFYLPALFSRVQQVVAAPEKPSVTTDTQRDGLDILAADGSLLWSRQSEAKFTKKFVDKAVRNELRKTVNTSPSIDPGLVAALGKTIDYLRFRGVQVMLVQTPYHPTYWAKVQGTPFGGLLQRLQEIASEMGRDHGAVVLNGYDPGRFGCTADQFIDQIHATPPCLGKVLRQVPGLVQGS